MMIYYAQGPILNRDDENKSRKGRVARYKKGPGSFRYLGTDVFFEHHPTILRKGRNVASIGANGEAVVDASGELVHENPNAPELTMDGRTQMGGPPTVVAVPSPDSRTLWGKTFWTGQVVFVDSPELAHKLRCLPSFEEVEGVAAPEALASDDDDADVDDFGNVVPRLDVAVKRGPGRPRKL